MAGADFRDADLSFADIDWPKDVDAARFEGATCPNLHVADASGCVGHEGKLGHLTTSERKRYVSTFESEPQQPDATPQCRVAPHLTRTFADGEYLLFGGRRYLMQSTTRFVDANRRGEMVVVEFSWDDEGRPRVEQTRDGCPTVVYESVD